jgi:hypothetical protein
MTMGLVRMLVTGMGGCGVKNLPPISSGHCTILVPPIYSVRSYRFVVDAPAPFFGVVVDRGGECGGGVDVDEVCVNSNKGWKEEMSASLVVVGNVDCIWHFDE